MKSLNSVQLIGNLSHDPESKETNGKNVTKFTVATGEEWLDKNSEKCSNTEWHSVVCFNKLGEIVNQYLKKGSRVFVSGKLKTSKWVDKNNENRYKTEVVVDELIMLDSKKRD